MVGWLPGKSKGKKMGTLERKTAELADKLSRMSFRRHSAPARQNSTSEDLGADLSLDPNLSTRMDDDVCDAIVIDVLPVHLLELVLRHLTLKVSILTFPFSHLCKSRCRRRWNFGVYAYLHPRQEDMLGDGCGLVEVVLVMCDIYPANLRLAQVDNDLDVHCCYVDWHWS